MERSYTFPTIAAKTGRNDGIRFCDLPGCIATGTTLDKAIHLAKEGLALHLWGMEQDGDPILSPTPLDDIHLKEGETLCLLDANMTVVRMTA